MKLSRTLQLATASAACAALPAPAALAGGEPKNVAPFTRHAAARPPVHLAAALQLSPRSSVGPARGESKNSPPFDVPVRSR